MRRLLAVAAAAVGTVLLGALWWAGRGGTGPVDGRGRPAPETSVARLGETESAPAAPAGSETRLAVQPPGMRAGAEAESTAALGSVLATAVDASTGALVPGTTVWVESLPGDLPWPEVRYATTDPGGRARFDGLEPGRARVALLGSAPRQVDVAAGGEVRVELRVPAGIDVDGRVVDGRGRAVPGADLWLSAAVDVESGGTRHGPGALVTRGTLVARTDARGRFRLRGIGSDQALGARKEGFAPSYLQRVRGEPGDEVPVRIVLAGRAAALHGRVIDFEGAPVADALVLVGDPAASDVVLPDGRRTWGAPVQGERTDDAGAFRFDTLAAGATPLLVRARGFAQREELVQLIEAGDTLVEVQLTPTPTVFGRVLDDVGRPVEGASVRLVTPQVGAGASARSDPEGRYELADLPLGDVELEASHPTEGRATTGFPLEAGERFGWVAELSPVRTFTGVVVDEIGQPLPGWEVAVRPEGKGERYERIALTGANGSFRISPVAERLRVYVYDPRRWTRFPALIVHDADPTAGPAELRVVDRSATTGVLVGRIVDPRGEPVSDALVSVWHQREKMWRGARPRPDGRFEVALIPPGDITLEINPAGFPSVGLGEPEVEQGAVLDVGTIRLQPAGTIRGELVGLEDDAAAAVWLELEGGDLLLGGVPLRRDGREFQSGPLQAGPYTVHAFGDFVETTSVACEVQPAVETAVAVELRAAGMRRLVLDVPPGVEEHYAIAVEVFDGDVLVWDGWTSLDSLEPVEFRVSVRPGDYRLHVRARYEPQRVLHEGRIRVDGLEGADPPLHVELGRG